jgi:hypothetical protein
VPGATGAAGPLVVSPPQAVSSNVEPKSKAGNFKEIVLLFMP